MSQQQLNADFAVPVCLDTERMAWEPSPSATVWRRRLHLSGPAEAGIVTSIVRYDAGATFHAHDHPDGEEILVLEGTFSDEHGDWPAGTYLLNPEGFRHAPGSREGCVLFVKLRQYAGAREQYAIRTADLPWVASADPGVQVKTLYRSDAFADVMTLERWSAGARRRDDGVELLVLAGGLEARGAKERYRLSRGSWLRWPRGHEVMLSSTMGCEIFVKRAPAESLA